MTDYVGKGVVGQDTHLAILLTGDGRGPWEKQQALLALLVDPDAYRHALSYPMRCPSPHDPTVFGYTFWSPRRVYPARDTAQPARLGGDACG